MITALIIYAAVSVTLGLGLYASGIYSDIKHGPDNKFGYYYKSSVAITLCLLTGVPLVNIGFVLLLLWIWVDAKIENAFTT